MASALDRTTVASVATVVCSQSIWAALFASVLGQRPTRVAWICTGIALAGVVVVTGAVGQRQLRLARAALTVPLAIMIAAFLLGEVPRLAVLPVPQ